MEETCRTIDKHKQGRGYIWVRGWIGRAGPPASQTLIVLSLEPDTMVLPSGEKATDQMVPLCALCFSALSSRDAAASTGAVRFELKGLRMCQCRHACTPDFDRLVVGARHDGLAVRREGHGEHVAAVCALLLGLELQGRCNKQGSGQIKVRCGIERAGPPVSQTLIVLSLEPDTMALPSGEKATDITDALCAPCFPALSSRVAATSKAEVGFGLDVEPGGLGHLQPRL